MGRQITRTTQQQRTPLPLLAGRSWGWTLSLAIIPLIPLGCNSKPSADDYFPLNPGLHWEYQVETDLRERTLTDRLHVDTLDATTLGTETAQVRRTSDGTDYYVTQRADGIYRIGKRTIVEQAPQADTPARMILPLPLQVGKNWSTLTQSYTVHRVIPNIEPPERSTLHFNMTYELAATDETVTVPAGTFAHCLRVDGQATLSLYADAKLGFHNFDATSREWYCPSVGLVKLERVEPLESEVFKGGKVTLELVGFQD